MGRVDRRRWQYPTAGALLAVSLAAFASSMREPGRSGRFYSISVTELRAPPEADVGRLRWDYPVYEKDPALEPLRAFYRQTCAGRVALDAAVCLSDRFAKAFQHGTPTKEFFDESYDPVQDLAEHLAGASGHCVTRSGLVSAILLSVAIPARVVQVFVTNVGHNALEVWDATTRDWVFFDPTFGLTYVGKKSGPSSAAVAMFGLEPGRWTRSGEQPAQDPSYFDLLAGDDARPAVRLPEPWLYVRAGSRTATWPYRGAFVHAGGQRWGHGCLQEILRPLFVFCAFAGLALTAYGRFARVRQRDDASATGDEAAASLADTDRAA